MLSPCLDLPLREHSVVVGRLPAWLRLLIHELQVGRNDGSCAWITDQFPSDEIRVAAIERIGEGSLNRVCADQVEEWRRRLLDIREDSVLIGRRELREYRPFRRLRLTVDCREA